MNQKLSAAPITLNGEKNLPRNLESVGYVAEIIIESSHSGDLL